MTYYDLKQMVADYMHRTDLTDQIPNFIELTRGRINRDLRVQPMVQRATITPADSVFSLPDDFLVIKELSRAATQGTGRVMLSAVQRHQLNLYQGATGNAAPLFYTIDGMDCEVVPYTDDTEYELIYYAAEPAFVNDWQTAGTLDRYPSIWLYGALYEGFSFIQDTENQSKAGTNFLDAVRSANAEAQMNQLGESPQMQGASTCL